MFEQVIISTRMGTIVQAGGWPGRYHVVDPVGNELSDPRVDLATAFRVLGSRRSSDPAPTIAAGLGAAPVANDLAGLPGTLDPAGH